MIGESVGTGFRQREIHLCGFGRSKVAVGTGILHLIEGVAEHLIMRLLAIEEEIDSLAHLFVLNLPVKIPTDHLGTLFGRNIGEQICAKTPCHGDIIGSP